MTAGVAAMHTTPLTIENIIKTNAKNLMTLTRSDLAAACTLHGIDATGKKAVLVKRLKQGIIAEVIKLPLCPGHQHYCQPVLAGHNHGFGTANPACSQCMGEIGNGHAFYQCHNIGTSCNFDICANCVISRKAAAE